MKMTKKMKFRFFFKFFPTLPIYSFQTFKKLFHVQIYFHTAHICVDRAVSDVLLIYFIFLKEPNVADPLLTTYVSVHDWPTHRRLYCRLIRSVVLK